MAGKKIIIDKYNYIRLQNDGKFELHCSASGPLGANVYFFNNNRGGLLVGKQRRSYAFVSKIQKATFTDN